MNFALSIFSAVLLILIFPRFDFTWLAPVALTPLLVACARERSWARRFLEGWAGGFVFWFGICYWIQFVLEVHGGMGQWGGWGTFVLFAILKGLHMAVFAALAGFVIDAFRATPTAAPTDPELDLLTPRELEVMRLLARGYAYKEIAGELFISAKTVETHASNVLRKLQLSNRHQLTRWAAERRML